ncbi:MAG: hypothetical protein SPJ89_05870 [Treponema sp.]|nr:hypothetical protein [Treponema sp.]
MKIKCLCLVIFSFMALGIVSCSSHSDGASFTSRLDSIDVFIAQGSTESAVKALKKLEKKAYSSYDRLGIYKRYTLLGEKVFAEKVLIRGLKKLPDNPELSAVYVNCLLRQDRLEEAFKISLCLENGPYSSLYSECILKKALAVVQEKSQVLDEAFNPAKKRSAKEKKDASLLPELSSDQIKEFFCSDKFISVYSGAFKGSKDNRWIFNAASVLMKNGDFKAAAELYPQKITNYKDSLFWGNVFFDCGLYAQSLDALEASSRLASLDGTGDYSESILAEILTLEADCCYIEGQEDRSEDLRQTLASMKGGKFLTPVLCMNGAMYSRRHKNTLEEYNRLDYIIRRFPDYYPAIAGKGQNAIDQLYKPKEDEISKKLRAFGVKTMEMEIRDQIPVIKIKDVYALMDLPDNDNPMFSVLKDELDLEYKKANKINKSVSDIWQLLENYESESACPSEIARYCTMRLIEERMIKEAEGVFDGYIHKKYNFNIFEKPEELELWECEAAAWFACKNADFKHGAELYGFIAERYGQRLPALNTSSGNISVSNALINLAVVYESIDKLNEALDILSLASSRTENAKEKAEILYRMAEINWNMGDSRSASRSLKYALSLDNSHNRTRLLQKKIKMEK